MGSSNSSQIYIAPGSPCWLVALVGLHQKGVLRSAPLVLCPRGGNGSGSQFLGFFSARVAGNRQMSPSSGLEVADGE